MKPDTKLPDKLSDLIDVALVDLEACEADPRYRIEMSEWHTPNGQCAVCLAGSVMAQRLGFAPGVSARPLQIYDETVRRRLYALDYCRRGLVLAACEAVHQPLGNAKESAVIADYETDPTAFKADMRRLAATLREHGL